jgi:transcriptional regulator with XRE-family HTH domain
MPAPRTFGKNLREAREKAKLTQDALAKRLGFKRQTPISIWERQDRLPHAATVEKIARALGCSPARLLRGVVTPYDKLRAATTPGTGGPTLLSADDERWLALGRRLDASSRRSLESFLELTLQAQGSAPDAGRAGDARYRTPPNKIPNGIAVAAPPRSRRAPAAALRA